MKGAWGSEETFFFAFRQPSHPLLVGTPGILHPAQRDTGKSKGQQQRGPDRYARQGKYARAPVNSGRPQL